MEQHFLFQTPSHTDRCIHALYSSQWGDTDGTPTYQLVLGFPGAPPLYSGVSPRFSALAASSLASVFPCLPRGKMEESIPGSL